MNSQIALGDAEHESLVEGLVALEVNGKKALQAARVLHKGEQRVSLRSRSQMLLCYRLPIGIADKRQRHLSASDRVPQSISSNQRKIN